MSIRKRVASCFCIALAGGLAGVPAVAARKGDLAPAAASAKAASPHPGAVEGGLVLDRLSKGDLRIWRAIERVVAESDASGTPRSPTLRRLLDWAGTSTHVLHVEMVGPPRLAAGQAGVFRVEHFDPTGLRHGAVIRLCPENIQRAKASPGPNAVLQSFVRFESLSTAERYAEVLAHELAHAEYFLENPERLAEVLAAQGIITASTSHLARSKGPSLEERIRRCEKPLAVLAASEAHAESVEALVLRELAGSPRSPMKIEHVR
jgi:hypothetical protein